MVEHTEGRGFDVRGANWDELGQADVEKSEGR